MSSSRTPAKIATTSTKPESASRWTASGSSSAAITRDVTDARGAWGAWASWRDTDRAMAASPRSADRVRAGRARLLLGDLAHDCLRLRDRRCGPGIREVERHRVDQRRIDRHDARPIVADPIEP